MKSDITLTADGPPVSKTMGVTITWDTGEAVVLNDTGMIEFVSHSIIEESTEPNAVVVWLEN